MVIHLKSNCGGKVSLQKAVKAIAIISLVFTSSLIALEIYLISNYGWPIVNSNVSKDSTSGIPSLDVILGERENFSQSAPDPTAVEFQSPTILNNVVDKNTGNEQTIWTSKNVIQMHADQFKYVVGFWFTTWFLDILLSISLYYGAVQKNETILLLWFYIRCGLLLSRVVCLIIYILAGITLIRKIPVIIIFIFRAYCLWTVGKFIDELREDRRKYYLGVNEMSNDPNGSLGGNEVTGYAKMGLINQLEYKMPISCISHSDGSTSPDLKYPYQFFS